MSHTITIEQQREWYRQREVERRQWRERCEQRAMILKTFAESRGWVPDDGGYAESAGLKIRHRYPAGGVAALILGARADYFPVPYQDHTTGFMIQEASGKWRPVALVSQPYDHVNNPESLQEMQEFASAYGLKVEFPDQLSWHNKHCIVCVFTRNESCGVWQHMDRLGTKWCRRNMTNESMSFGNPPRMLVDPAEHVKYVEPLQKSLYRFNIKHARARNWLFDDADRWSPSAEVFVWRGYRHQPINQLDANAIQAVTIRPNCWRR